MEKSIYSEEYQHFLKKLKEARRTAGLSQIDMAARLGEGATQSFVSKCERGERRIDIAELRAFCQAIGVPLVEFVESVEREIEATTRQAGVAEEAPRRG
jgi:transcriptional regulator with XRE-family HTH domain